MVGPSLREDIEPAAKEVAFSNQFDTRPLHTEVRLVASVHAGPAQLSDRRTQHARLAGSIEFQRKRARAQSRGGGALLAREFYCSMQCQRAAWHGGHWIACGPVIPSLCDVTCDGVVEDEA